MKASHVVIAGVVAGVALGGGMSFARFSHSPPFEVKATTADVDRSQPLPKVHVDHAYWDFGLVDRDVDVRHAFAITNEGTAPLTLKDAGTTCTKCTIAELEKSELAPGETTEVTIVYHTSIYQPNFTQTAFLKTNDPDKRRIELRIAGAVTTRFRVIPDVVALNKISSTETRTATVKIISLVSNKIEIVAHEFTGAETAQFFDIATAPLAADELSEPRESGCAWF